MQAGGLTSHVSVLSMMLRFATHTALLHLNPLPKAICKQHMRGVSMFYQPPRLPKQTALMTARQHMPGRQHLHHVTLAPRWGWIACAVLACGLRVSHLQHAVACLDAPEVLDEGEHIPDAAAADVAVAVQRRTRGLHIVLRQAQL